MTGGLKTHRKRSQRMTRMSFSRQKLFAIIALMVAVTSQTGCDYRWSTSDREQVRAMLVKEIGLPIREQPNDAKVDQVVLANSAPESANAQLDRGGSSQSDQQSPNHWVDPRLLPILQWEIIYLGNRPVGYTRRSIEIATPSQLKDLKVPAPIASSSLLCIEAESRIRITRKTSDPVDQSVTLRTLEKPNGELVAIVGSIDTGISKRSFQGLVKDGSLGIESTENKVVSNISVPWEPNYRGPFAIEQALRKAPMKLKEVRTVRYLDPFQMVITESRLDALSEGDTVGLDGSISSRLEIENRSITQGRNTTSLLWTDSKGVVRKSYTPGIDRQTFDCDPVTARYVISKEEFEATIFKDLPLLGTFANLPDTGLASFRVTSDLLSKDGTISSRTNQTAERINERTWDIQVRRIDALEEASSAESPEQDTLASAGMIDWKDPSVQRWIGLQTGSGPKLEEQGRGERSETKLSEQCRIRANTARAWIAKAVARTGLDRSIQTPASTLRERKGDCIDQAILLTATLRSLEIPARVAIGFRAEPSSVRPTIRLHLWVEYHDSTKWIPIDSTIDDDTVPPDRIKITESTLPSINAYEPILSAIRLIPDIEVTARTRKP
jgi:hypothetical protein